MRAPILLLIFTATFASPIHAEDAVVRAIVAHAKAHPSGDASFSFDQSSYHGDLSQLPIGVFDSGIGGLTVLQAILELDAFHNDTLQPGSDGIADFADERFIYFGDQANMPYGNYPAAGKTDYLRELILKDALFLLGKRRFATDATHPLFDKPPVKAIVIACNTATAYGLEDIRTAVAAWDLPVVVVGVIEAGARGVQHVHRDAGEAVAVLATVGTCASGAYPKWIGGTLGRAGRGVPLIQQHGSANLAGVIEGDPAFDETIAQCATREVRALLDGHRQSGHRTPIGTIVLGCTHYPLAQAEIDAAFAELRGQNEYRDLIAARRAYVNPAEWTARELFRTLASARLRNKPGKLPVAQRDTFYISVANQKCVKAELSTDGTLTHNYKYGRSAGELGIEDTFPVPLRPEMLPSTSAKLVREKLPLVWQRLTAP